jgi:hypothetical protein
LNSPKCHHLGEWIRGHQKQNIFCTKIQHVEHVKT